MRSENGFPSSHRLLKSRDFTVLSKEGENFRNAGFTVYYLANCFGHPRLGVTVSKRVSKKACVRNNIKRQIREEFRKKKKFLPPADVVFIAKTNASNLSSRDLATSIGDLLYIIHHNFGENC